MTVQWFKTDDPTARIVAYEWRPQEEGSAFGSLYIVTREHPSDVWNPPQLLAGGGGMLLRTARSVAQNEGFTVEVRVES